MKLNKIDQKWMAIGISISISAAIVLLFTAFSISVLNDYGFILFIIVPMMLGLMSSLIYGHYQQRTFKESQVVSFYTLLIVCGGLILIRMEGLICVIMASPIVAAFTFIGACIGHRYQRSKRGTVIRVLSLNLIIIPMLMTVETKITDETSELIKVTTSIQINAPIEKVWQNVIVFPPIDEPDEVIFKTGIAYPTSSQIVGNGIGAIRYCEFNTGKFVEPITIWDAPNHLQFSVEEQPAPLKDMLMEEVPPNMYKYFTSTKGEFRLHPVSESITLLEGSTWYYHKIKPVAYWRLWSEYIIHSIHERVLKHIKVVSEK